MFDRKSHWQHVYQQRSVTDVSWYQGEPTLSLDLIEQSGVNRGDSIIDVGGGASVLVDRLCSAGFTNLSVLDISGNALLNTKNRLGEQANGVEWFEADITQFEVPHPFSLWHDRAVFHFLTEERDRQSYVRRLNDALRPGGQLIIAAFAMGGPTKCSDLDIVQYDLEKLMLVLGEEFEFVEERRELHITPANKEQKFNYFRFEKV